MALTDQQRAQLSDEVRLGRQAQQAYDVYVKRHIDSTVQNIYEGIEVLSVTQKEELIELKGLLTAIRGLEMSVLRDIETGKLAAIQLENTNE